MYEEPTAISDLEEGYLNVKVKRGKQGHDNDNNLEASERSKTLG